MLLGWEEVAKIRNCKENCRTSIRREIIKIGCKEYKSLQGLKEVLRGIKSIKIYCKVYKRLLGLEKVAKIRNYTNLTWFYD